MFEFPSVLYIAWSLHTFSAKPANLELAFQMPYIFPQSWIGSDVCLFFWHALGKKVQSPQKDYILRMKRYFVMNCFLLWCFNSQARHTSPQAPLWTPAKEDPTKMCSWHGTAVTSKNPPRETRASTRNRHSIIPNYKALARDMTWYMPDLSPTWLKFNSRQQQECETPKAQQTLKLPKHPTNTLQHWFCSQQTLGDGDTLWANCMFCRRGATVFTTSYKIFIYF